VDECRKHIVAEGKRHEVKEIDVHRQVAELGPGGLEPAPMADPQFGNSEVMNQCITGDRGRKTEERFGDGIPQKNEEDRINCDSLMSSRQRNATLPSVWLFDAFAVCRYDVHEFSRV